MLEALSSELCVAERREGSCVAVVGCTVGGGAVPHVSLAFAVRFVIPVCERCRGGIDDDECDPDCAQPGLAVRVD